MNPADFPSSIAFKLCLVAVSMTMLAASGCGEGEADFNTDDTVGGDPLDPNDPTFGTGEDWLTMDDLGVDEIAIINLKRDAIDLGLVLGKQAVADELNLVLEDMGVPQRYASTVTTGTEYLPPSPQACPFLEPPPAGTSSLDCRALSDRATVAAYSQITVLEAQNPLDNQFDNLRDDNEFWYREGIMTGVDNEAILALRQIRDSGMCDQAPLPRQSAYEAGVEQGRQLYIEKLNERFVETGMSGMRYPDQITQIEVCRSDVTFLAPARSAALAATEDRSREVPLCDGYNPTNLDELAALDEANAQYRQGMERGIDSEDSLASEKIFREVPCNVGDPLVLDIDGDGVHLVPVWASHTEFDLFGMNRLLRTAWIQGDDAFLALDRDGSGTIDSGRELFANFIGERGYNEVPTGFDHLALYDSADNGGNQDGLISDADAIFDQLRLWQDRNADGISQTAELHTLPSLGVRALTLGYQAHRGDDPQLTHRATFLRNARGVFRTGSQTGEVFDAWLRYGHARRPL